RRSRSGFDARQQGRGAGERANRAHVKPGNRGVGRQSLFLKMLVLDDGGERSTSRAQAAQRRFECAVHEVELAQRCGKVANRQTAGEETLLKRAALDSLVQCVRTLAQCLAQTFGNNFHKMLLSIPEWPRACKIGASCSIEAQPGPATQSTRDP